MGSCRSFSGIVTIGRQATAESRGGGHRVRAGGQREGPGRRGGGGGRSQGGTSGGNRDSSFVEDITV